MESVGRERECRRLLLELREHALDDLALASHCPELDDDRRVGLIPAAEASKQQQGRSQAAQRGHREHRLAYLTDYVVTRPVHLTCVGLLEHCRLWRASNGEW